MSGHKFERMSWALRYVIAAFVLSWVISLLGRHITPDQAAAFDKLADTFFDDPHYRAIERGG